jgi:lysozyme
MNAIARVNASRRLSPAALAFLKGFEWFVPYPYDDAIAPVRGVYREWTGGPVKGTLTIGYGHTNAAAHPLKIKPGLRITEAEAREILDVDLDPCEGDVRRMVTVPLTQGEFDACTDFDFNCGEDNFANIARRLNAGDYAGARAALDLYVNPPVYRAGLQRRRDGEQALWDLPDPVSIAPRPRLPAPADVALPPRPEILGEDPARCPTVVAPPIAPEIPPADRGAHSRPSRCTTAPRSSRITAWRHLAHRRRRRRRGRRRCRHDDRPGERARLPGRQRQRAHFGRHRARPHRRPHHRRRRRLCALCAMGSRRPAAAGVPARVAQAPPPLKWPTQFD